MIVYNDLATLNNPLTQKQALEQWILDIQTYNSLNADHTALIAWVNKYCR